MAITKLETEQLAMLARFELSESETEDYTKELNAILEFAGIMNEVNTEDVGNTVNVLPIANVFREDTAGNTLEQERALQNAPDQANGYFRVPRIM